VTPSNTRTEPKVLEEPWVFVFMEFTAGPIAVRPWREADLPLIAKWLSDPQVLRFYEGRDHPHDLLKARAVFEEETEDHCCVFSFQGEPIGYIQFCPIDAEESGMPAHERVWGIDLYIGEPAFWGRGIGTALVRAGAAQLLAQNFAGRVTLDPQTWNTRAVRSYEKAGFVKRRLMPRFEFHEGEWRDNWQMEFVPQRALRVERVTHLPVDELQPLRDEATAQGFEFAGRLIDDFVNGRNRFDKEGEALFIVRNGEALAGIGGLNIDHYAHDPSVGRVRHVYVLDAQRRHGAGRALLTAIMSAAIESFAELRLRTNTHEGALFYESLGFAPAVDTDSATHRIRFAPRPLP
jgi:aminoglycoside 6'-N-acetyltransferase